MVDDAARTLVLVCAGAWLLAIVLHAAARSEHAVDAEHAGDCARSPLVVEAAVAAAEAQSSVVEPIEGLIFSYVRVRQQSTELVFSSVVIDQLIAFVALYDK